MSNVYPFKLGNYLDDIGGGYYQITLSIKALSSDMAVKEGQTYDAIRFNPRTNKFCIDFDNGFIGWYPEEMFTYEGKKVKYMLVMYDLKNGLKRLESVHLDSPPSLEAIQQAIALYGGTKHEVQEVSIMSRRKTDED